MDVLRTFVVDISPVFGGVVICLVICVTIARRIAVEQRSKREKQKYDYEAAMADKRNKAIEYQAPVNKAPVVRDYGEA